MKKTLLVLLCLVTLSGWAQKSQIESAALYFNNAEMEDAKKAIVTVPEDQLSIAIGKSGQNVRLASKLTGYDLDITSDQPKPEPKPEPAAPSKPVEPKPMPRLKRKDQLESSLLDAIEEHGE